MRIDTREPGKREDRFLHGDPAGVGVGQVEFRQLLAGHDLRRDAGNRRTDSLGDERDRPAGARVRF